MNTSVELLKSDLQECAKLYKNIGFCLYGQQLISDDILAKWTNELANFNGFIFNDAVGSSGEKGEYYVADGPSTFKLLEGLEELYKDCIPVMEQITGEKIIPSPYELSIVNAKVYKDTGSQGAHYDTQPTSCLLFVSHGAPLNIQLLDGTWVDIDPVPGCIAVFKGRECLHRVPALNSPQFRVTIPMNYYFENDVWRPEWIDEAIYLNKDYVSA